MQVQALRRLGLLLAYPRPVGHTVALFDRRKGKKTG